MYVGNPYDMEKEDEKNEQMSSSAACNTILTTVKVVSTHLIHSCKCYPQLGANCTARCCAKSQLLCSGAEAKERGALPPYTWANCGHYVPLCYTS